MTQTKRGNHTKKAASGRKKAPVKANAESDIVSEVLLILFFVLCVLLLLSCFGLGGSFGDVIGKLLFGVFGYLEYLFPFALFFGVCFYLSNAGNKVAVVKLAAGIAALLLLTALAEGIYPSAGGWFGKIIFGMLSKLFGTIGTYILLAALLIAAGVIVSEKSFVKGVKRGSSRVYQTAKTENQKIREKNEERQIKRAEKAARTPARNIELKKNPEPKDEMREILREEAQAETLKETGFEENGFEEKPQTKRVRRKGFGEKAVEEQKPEELGTEADFEGQELKSRELDEKKTRNKETANKEIKQREKIILSPEMTKLPVGSEIEAIDRSNTESETIEQEAAEKKTPEKRNRKEQETGREQTGAVSAPKYQYPPLRLLNAPKAGGNRTSTAQLRETAVNLQQLLKDFGVGVTVTNFSCGPTVTRYELQPDHGVKVSKVLSLVDDIKLNLAVSDLRIEAPIPGKAAIGIEVPNKENSMVTLRELLASDEFTEHSSKIAFAVGKDIGGENIVTDIAKMPHLLIAGATGSGKSVCINTLIMSILYKASPEEVKLIMIDPKVVELSTYNGIPHLLIPVVTDPKKAAGALNWAVAEMTRRYQLFADYQVRNLQGYNDKVKSIELLEEENKPQRLPQIVVIVDELADLMMVASQEVEDAICRLAQLARAAGIHLIIATQRPSVNVITGLIKANMPSRLAFKVSSGVDSRTILDMNGAEKLLGKGDMLFYPYGYSEPVRIQGAFVSDEEVNAVVDFLKSNNQSTEIRSDIEEHMKKQEKEGAGTKDASGNDTLFLEAGRLIIEKDKASIGMLQRWFKIGFNRAARIMEQLAEAGVVGPEQGTKAREVLMSPEQFEQYIDEYL